MRIPGFNRPEREPIVDPDTGQVYVERRRGESQEAFEARLAAVARERRIDHASIRPADAPPLARPAPRAEAPTRRHRRRGLGLAGLIVVLVAVLGALWMALAAREGSFAAGGAVVDQKLAQVTEPARLAANRAADRTGQAVEQAGQKLEAQGERIRDKAH